MLCLSSVSASSNTSCPTWFYYDNSTQQCHCDPLLYCSTPAEGPAEIFEGSCATLSEQKGVLYYFGKCPFRHRINSTNRWLAKLPSDPDMLDDVMCRLTTEKVCSVENVLTDTVLLCIHAIKLFQVRFGIFRSSSLFPAGTDPHHTVFHFPHFIPCQYHLWSLTGVPDSLSRDHMSIKHTPGAN